jgi:hypothetical protein
VPERTQAGENRLVSARPLVMPEWLEGLAALLPAENHSSVIDGRVPFRGRLKVAQDAVLG